MTIELTGATWQFALMWGCLAVLAIGAAVGAILALGHAAGRIRRLIWWLGPVGCLLAGPGIVHTFCYGSTKGPGQVWAFQFLNGLTDAGSVCTNDQVIARWTATPMLMDGNYAVKMQWRNATVTNAAGEVTDAWHAGEDARVQDLQHTWTIPDATNLHVLCWAEYVPPVVVHTNGVYKLIGTMRSMDDSERYVTPGIRIVATVDGGETDVLTPTNRPPNPSILLNSLMEEGNDEE